MKHIIHQFALLLLLSLLTQNIFASHIVGSDISYQCTATTNVYKVTIKLYRDCAGIQFCPGCQNPIPNGSVSGCMLGSSSGNATITGRSPSCNGTNFGNFNSQMAAVSGASGIDIIKTCETSASTKTICTNCNTRTSGTFYPGIEIYTFEGNVNLNNIPVSCCEVSLSYSECCRNGAITNFMPGNMYTEAVLNRCITPCNSAPVFTNDATVLVCTSQDVTINAGAIDPDGDSLSYAFGQSLQGFGSSVPWNAPFSASYPFPYLGAPNPNAASPGGLRINPNNGDVSFRPEGYFVSNLVIEVTQWKLIGGTYTNVGVTRRDIQFQTILCPSNLPPQILVYKDGVKQTGLQNFKVIAGKEICLDLVAEDSWNFTSSDPSKWIYADTTDLIWNNPGAFDFSMSNATWTRNYILAQRGINGPKNDSFKFCWTPPSSAARNTPYSFTAIAKDRFCPVIGVVANGITIQVEDNLNSIRSSNLLLETDLKVHPNPTKTEITITNKNGWSGKQFVISNIIGQELLRGKLNQDETIINLAELKAGTYLLSIDGINKQAIKIIKEE